MFAEVRQMHALAQQWQILDQPHKQCVCYIRVLHIWRWLVQYSDITVMGQHWIANRAM